MKNKSLIYALIAIALIIVVAVIVHTKGPQNPGLSTYDNFGISFQYPTEWGIADESFYDNGIGSVNFDLATSSQGFSFLIEQDTNPMGTGLMNETFDQMIERYKANNKYIYDTKDVTVDGVSGKELFYRNAVTGEPFSVDAIFPFHDGFYVTFGSDYNAVPLNTFDTVILSVKWDNSTLMKENSANKMFTYRNNGISFDFPQKLNTDYASLNMQTSVKKTDSSKLDANGCPVFEEGPLGTAASSTIVMVRDVRFCFSTTSGVGAGQLYTWYIYTTAKGGNTYMIDYVVHSSNGCYGYQNSLDINAPDNEKFRACREDMNNRAILIDKPIQDSISTFTFY